MLRFTPNKQRLHSRIAVIVSKKVFKAAVKRNRARRRLFEIVRHEFETIDGTFDITFTVFSPEVIVIPHTELRAEVQQLLISAGLTRDERSPS